VRDIVHSLKVRYPHTPLIVEARPVTVEEHPDLIAGVGRLASPVRRTDLLACTAEAVGAATPGADPEPAPVNGRPCAP
jgi:hypothetical protein